MDNRDVIVSNICEELDEDITDQFDQNESDAALNNEKYFTVASSDGKTIQIRNKYDEDRDYLFYVYMVI